MNIRNTIITIVLSPTLGASVAVAQAPTATAPAAVPSIESASALNKKNSVNVSPLGLLVGSYGVNYERLLDGHHGLLVEGNFASSSSSNASNSSFGGTLGYRYHWSGGQDSGFVGLNLSYSSGSSEAVVTTDDGMTSFDLDTTATTITANVGRRWAWDSGLNVTLRFGLGKGDYDVSTDSEDPDAQEAVELVDDLLEFLPLAVDGELSVGYAF